ncbi:MAG TPA: hypothetical protein VGF81_16770 [Solirubrobacteraceae bacterium]|jgi:hypothetical protein
MRRALLIAVLVALALPAIALADADPASDVLLGAPVFYPYQPPVPAALQKKLNAEVTAAGRTHFPIKIALISSPVDLGALPTMFAKPQQYATFLDQEISFNSKQPLLVVMANGYGSAGLPPAAAAAVSSLPKPSGKDGEALAQAALEAVPKLAEAAGHKVPNAGGGSGGSSGGSSGLLIVILVVVAVLAAGTVILVRRRRAVVRGRADRGSRAAR